MSGAKVDGLPGLRALLLETPDQFPRTVTAKLLAYALGQPVGANLSGAVILFVLAVVAAGSLLTFAWVELPSGASGVRRHSPWAAVLGLFASLPICYLVVVLVLQVLLPALR